MAEPDTRLGVVFDANKLCYAVSASSKPAFIERIGQIEFNFDLIEALKRRDPDTFPGFCDTVGTLIREQDVTEISVLYPPRLECWSIVPKTVCDQEDERLAHLNILMQGTPVRDIAPEWHTISNRDFKLLKVRKKQHLESIAALLNTPLYSSLYSDFQLGEKWMRINSFNSSFMTVSCGKDILSIASFLLGKLRAATYISFDDISDIPYLWLQHASHLHWLHGMHEQILVYGGEAGRVCQELRAYWDDDTEIVVMDSLQGMGLSSVEKTFSFPLERAFPATMLSAY